MVDKNVKELIEQIESLKCKLSRYERFEEIRKRKFKSPKDITNAIFDVIESGLHVCKCYATDCGGCDPESGEYSLEYTGHYCDLNGEIFNCDFEIDIQVDLLNDTGSNDFDGEDGDENE